MKNEAEATLFKDEFNKSILGNHPGSLYFQKSLLNLCG